MKTKIIFLLIFLPLIGVSQQYFPFEIKLIPVSELKTKTDIIINLEITPRFKCDSVNISISKFGKIFVGGSSKWNERMGSRTILKHSFTVRIPENDTVGFEVKVVSSKIGHQADLFFVSTTQVIQTFPGNPRYNPKITSPVFKVKAENNQMNNRYIELPDSLNQKLGKEIIIKYDSSVNKSVGILKTSDQNAIDTTRKFTKENIKIK